MSIHRFSTHRDDHHRRSRNVIAYHVVAAGLLCLLLVAPHSADAQCPCVTQASGFAGGDGSPGDPYQVCSPAHLDNVRNHLSSHFLQIADIDMTGVAFMPIGDNNNPFTGRFDGQGRIIDNLNFDQPLTIFVGLFGVVAVSGQLNSIDIDNAFLRGDSQTGGIVGQNMGTITSCSFSGTVSGANFTGGIAGENSGNVLTSDSAGQVTGSNLVGGLVGRSNESTLERV